MLFPSEDIPQAEEVSAPEETPRWPRNLKFPLATSYKTASSLLLLVGLGIAIEITAPSAEILAFPETPFSPDSAMIIPLFASDHIKKALPYTLPTATP